MAMARKLAEAKVRVYAVRNGRRKVGETFKTADSQYNNLQVALRRKVRGLCREDAQFNVEEQEVAP